MKYDVEKIAKDQAKEALKNETEGRIRDKEATEPRITEHTYISYVVVDLKDNEIAIESRDSFALPDMAVGAATA